MWKALIRTDNDRVAALLRIALGIVILPHGLQKVFGWFGGGGLSGTLGFFEQTFGVPAALTLLVIAAEFLGALGLIVGFLSRAAAAGIGLVLLGAVYLVHWDVGFFMNWSGAQGGEGFEYHILAVAIALAVVIRGSGAWSIDRALYDRSTDALVTAEAPRAPERKAA